MTHNFVGSVALLLLLAVGCSRPSNPARNVVEFANNEEKNAARDLKMIGLGYKTFREWNQVPPQSSDELQTKTVNDPPIDFTRYHIIWGVDLEAISAPRTVLAYDVDVPAKGGIVLFHDVTLGRVSAAEFSALPKATAAPAIAKRPVDRSFTPAEYVAEYNKLKDRMGQNYKGKVIELKGIVKSLSGSARPDVDIAATVDSPEAVHCRMAGNDEFWAKFSRGQAVTMKGLVSEGGGFLIECEIMELGPSKALNMTAEELAREFTADKDKARMAFSEKSFLLTGEVDSVEPGFRSLLVKLKGTAENSVDCSFKSDETTKVRDSQLVPGAKLKLYGEFDFNTQLDKCQLITK